MPLDKGRIDYEIHKKVWRTILYVGNKDIKIGDFKTREEAINALQNAIKMRSNMPPIRIPERVLVWRERQRRGSIMRPKTFKRIKGKAKRAGYRVPSAVGGKSYYVTLLSKYLDVHPKDVGVKILLSKLVKRRGKRAKVRKNPSSQPTLIYDKLLGIEARKSHGKFKGENFRHDFKHDTDAVVMGNPDGSLTIRSKKGKRLWKKFSY